MQKLHLIFFTMLSLSISWGVYGEGKRYISDSLITYVHSGPGSQYRIVGSLNAGDTVTLLSVNQTENYGQIRDEKGRIVWIPLNQPSQSPSMRARLPELEQEVKTLTTKLNNIDDSWNQRTAEMQQEVAASSSIIDGLKQENDALKNQLVVVQKK